MLASVIVGPESTGGKIPPSPRRRRLLAAQATSAMDAATAMAGA